MFIVGSCCTTFGQDVCRVTVPATVLREDGGSVYNLRPEQFHIALHGKKQPSEIAISEREDRNVSVLLDNSGSMYGERGEESPTHRKSVRAASDILKNLPPQATVRFGVFASKSTTVEGVPDGLKLLSQTTLNKKSGRTALWQSTQEMALTMNQPGAIIVVSDCGDNHSLVNEGKLRDQLLARRIRFVAVMTLEHDAPPLVLEELNGPPECEALAKATGGMRGELKGDGALTPESVRAMLHTYRITLTLPRSSARERLKLQVAPQYEDQQHLMIFAPKSLPGCDPQ